MNTFDKEKILKKYGGRYALADSDPAIYFDSWLNVLAYIEEHNRAYPDCPLNVTDFVEHRGPIYIVQDREAGNVIDYYLSLLDAEKSLAYYEEQDKEEGNYTPDFYEIVEF